MTGVQTCALPISGANDIQFKNTSGANTGKIESDGNNLVLSNAVGEDRKSVVGKECRSRWSTYH